MKKRKYTISFLREKENILLINKIYTKIFIFIFFASIQSIVTKNWNHIIAAERISHSELFRKTKTIYSLEYWILGIPQIMLKK